MSEKSFYDEYASCAVCPRACHADRRTSHGFCGMGDRLIAAKAMVHKGEEPCICEHGGCGAVFFSGCVLGCVFCQNASISHGQKGKEISEERLSEILLSFQENGAQSIDLVSPTQFTPTLTRVLSASRRELRIPVVWNTGGYETVATVRKVMPVADIFLQDVKYCDPAVSRKYAGVSDYFDRALDATAEMVKGKGRPAFDTDGRMTGGVILRHLVLPGNRKDSIAVLRRVADTVGAENVVLSLMSQYTPPSFPIPYRELTRKLTSFEYDSVCEEAVRLGYHGYFQERCSATDEWLPSFDFGGL